MPYLLFDAAYEGNFDEVRRLVESGSDIDERNTVGATPLFAACGCNHREVTKYLLRHGANPMVTQQDGVTPLWIAAYNGHDHIITYLLSYMSSSLKRAAIEQARNDGVTPLYVACLRGRTSVVKLLLLSGADAHRCVKGDSPRGLVFGKRDMQSKSILEMLNGSVSADMTTVIAVAPDCAGADVVRTTVRDASAYDALEIIGDHTFSLRKMLGRGSFGVVFTSTWKTSVVAVKKTVNVELSAEERATIIEEAKAIAALRPHHFFCWFAICHRPCGFYFIMEEVESLYARLHHRDMLWDIRLHIANQILGALSVLHHAKIPHGNLSSKNVFLDRSSVLQLSDAGLPTLKKAVFNKVGLDIESIKRRSPERLRDAASVSAADDVYSYGVILWELATHRDPMEGKTEREAIDLVSRDRMEEYAELPEKPIFMTSLIRRCWQTDPRARPTVEELKEDLQREGALFLGRSFPRMMLRVPCDS